VSRLPVPYGTACRLPAAGLRTAANWDSNTVLICLNPTTLARRRATESTYFRLFVAPYLPGT